MVCDSRLSLLTFLVIMDYIENDVPFLLVKLESWTCRKEGWIFFFFTTRVEILLLESVKFQVSLEESSRGALVKFIFFSAWSLYN